MANDVEFINGLMFKAPNDRAPEYVKAKGSIRRAELRAWLDTGDSEWVNFDVKVSQGGKWYAAIDNWKPDTGNGATRNGAPRRNAPAKPNAPAFDPNEYKDDIPF